MTTEAICATYPNLVSLQGRLANELKISFGYAPAVAAAIADTANGIYSEETELVKPGTMLYSAVDRSEPAGKPLDMCKRVNVRLAKWEPSDPKNADKRKKVVFRRICQEAYDQGGALTIEDCDRILILGERTIKRYFSEFKKAGVIIPLRGYIRSTGRGQTHKTEIITMYLENASFGDIQRRTYHSVEAITRYIAAFSRVVVCYAKQGMKVDDIAMVVRISKDVVRQYLDIFEKYDPSENDRLGRILEPAEFKALIQPFKKKMVMI